MENERRASWTSAPVHIQNAQTKITVQREMAAPRNLRI